MGRSGGVAGSNAFLLIGFVLLGLSYGQSAGTVTSNFSAHYRYTGAALSSDLAWLFGALCWLTTATRIYSGYLTLKQLQRQA